MIYTCVKYQSINQYTLKKMKDRKVKHILSGEGVGQMEKVIESKHGG
jgi:hypothetical protein